MTQPTWTPAPQPPAYGAPAAATPIGGILGLAGALILAVSLFLPWQNLSFDFGIEGFDIPDTNISGISSWQGIVVAVAAIAAIALGILALVLKTRGGRLGVGIGLAAAGGISLLIALVGIADAAWGLYVAILGALMVVGGGVLAILESRRLPAKAAPPYAPPPYAPPAAPPPPY